MCTKKFKVGDRARVIKNNSENGLSANIVKIEGDWAWAYWYKGTNSDLLGGIHFSDLELINGKENCKCIRCERCGYLIDN